MSILNDAEIEALCCNSISTMIHPYSSQQNRFDEQGNKLVSWGLSSYGYDVRVAPDFYVFSNVNNSLVDPKNFDEDSYVRKQADSCIIPPNGFVLARTLEYFKMPRDVSGIVLGKSTYARCGISCLATPIEAGWEGNLVLEFANTTPVPVKFYANEGAAQIMFFRGQPCITSYADRSGKYQGQRDITLPKV